MALQRIPHPEIEAFRAQWESDRSLSVRKIVEITGINRGLVQRHMQRNGWHRTPEMIAASIAANAIAHKARVSERAKKKRLLAIPTTTVRIAEFQKRPKQQKINQAFEAYRDQYAVDPALTLPKIAALCGVKSASVESYARRMHWERPADVKRAATRLASAQSIKTASEAKRAQAARESALAAVPRAAIPSVWDLATGRRVTTDRRHAEVYA